MAKNPMQRKARNSFILGMFITLIITGSIIGLLVFKLININKENKEKEQGLKNAYVLVTDIKSGDSIKLENLNLLNEPSIFGYIKINNTSAEVLNILKDNKKISDNFMFDEYLSNGIFDINKYNDSLSNYIERQSKKLTTSFIQGLEYVGIRIPAQSMQSFMNLKVVAFTPEETNVVYIPSEIILYQGSDFDIDKLYMMGASINNQGIYDS